MLRIGRVASALGAVALAAVFVGWWQDPPPITAADAVTIAEEGYAAAGLAAVEVETDPSRGSYQGAADNDAIDVWRTTAVLDGGTVLLWLARDDGEPVFLDDRSPDSSTQLLTDEQFQVLADLDSNPGGDGRIGRNLAVTAAAGLVLVLAVLFATRTPEPIRSPDDPRRARPTPPAAQRSHGRLRAEVGEAQRVVHRRQADDVPSGRDAARGGRRAGGPA